MQSSSVVAYRVLIASYVAFYIAAIVFGLFFPDQLTDKVYEYKSSIHPGLHYSFQIWTTLMIIYVLSLTISVVGMWLYWRPARILLFVTTTLGFSIPYIMGLGPVVWSATADQLDSLSSMCLGAFVALSFLGPISKRFSA